MQGCSEDKYATFRIVLPLDKGVTYGLSGETATYAQRVYINGEIVNETGTVCDNVQEFIPTSDKYTVYFTPQTDTTEIIIQHAWFNHRTGTVHKLSLSRTERSFDESKQRESEVTRMNETLEKLDRLKTDFMHNIAHEMKTPLTVMSGYAQLTEKQIEKNVVNEETLSNLETISSEAQRLSDMVTKLLSVSHNEVTAMELGRFKAEDILADAAAVCRPILASVGTSFAQKCTIARI